MNTKPLEHTRINIKDEFQAFKEAKIQNMPPKPQVEVKESTQSEDHQLSEADTVQSPIKQQSIAEPEVLTLNEPDPKEPVVQSPVASELGLDEPPEIIENTTPNDWAHSIPEAQLQEWWKEFAETQSMKTASFMKTLRPTALGKEIIVVLPPSKAEVLDNVKFPFNRFIEEKSEGKLTTLVIELGELQETDRKPYTEKEKLDFLIKKHPQIENLIDKLGLRIP